MQIDSLLVCNYVFKPLAENKCPGQITIGLNDLGIRTSMVTLRKPQLKGYSAPFRLIEANAEDLRSADFWREQTEKGVLYYFSHPAHAAILDAIKKSGKRIVIKLDSDGKLFYPQHNINLPRFRANGPLTTAMRFLKWHLPLVNRYWSFQIIRQLELADKIIIESDQALQNLTKGLRYWGKESVASKLVQIPNPVSPSLTSSERPQISDKQNLIVAVGRWEDFSQKNTPTMLAVLGDVLTKQPQWSAKVVGSGKETLKSLKSRVPHDIQDRIEIVGEVEHSQIVNLFRRSKIFFMPSRYEGLTIAGSEAVVMGSSIVGTPIAATQYLANKGLSGTVSEGFDILALGLALQKDILKWHNGEYDPAVIADFWRPKLGRSKIADQVYNLFKDDQPA